jgi:hypothetical protein
MSLVGFEATIPPFELAKTIHVLDRAATLNGRTLSVLREAHCTYTWAILNHKENSTKFEGVWMSAQVFRL